MYAPPPPPGARPPPPQYGLGKRPAEGPPPRYEGGYGPPAYGPPPPQGGPPAYGGPAEGAPAQKRARTGPPQPGVEPTPSKVLHVRNLPPNCTEQEIGAFIGQFGTVVTILILRGKNQAFAEMTDVETARYVYDYHKHQRGSIRGQHVYFGFSDRDVITIPPQHQKESERPCRTLLVTVSNLKYPVTIDALYEVFTRFGRIQRIVQFTRAGEYTALIQYADPNAAGAAKSQIDGQNIYTGCCTLKISFSAFSVVCVRYNSESARDYERPPDHAYGPPPGSDPASLLAVTAASMPGVLSPDPTIQAAQIAAATQAVRHALNTMGAPPPPPPHGHPPPPPHHHGPPPPPPPSHHHHAYPPPPPPSYYPPPPVPPPYGGPPSPYMQPPPGPGYLHPGAGVSAPVTSGAGCVLLVNNVPRNSGVSPEQLFTLFGVYGDVLRVKILFNNPESALVQMANQQQADLARQHLDGAPLYGSKMKVSTSKFREVALPKPGQPDYEHQHLTKDFSQSPLHRFKQPGSKNYGNICAPSAGLHVSNIAASASEEELRALFSRHGHVLSFRFMKSEKRMALLQMDSLSAAIVALIHTHNVRVGDLNLRVSFSKSQVDGQRGGGGGGPPGGGGPHASVGSPHGGGPRAYGGGPQHSGGGGGPQGGYGGGGGGRAAANSDAAYYLSGGSKGVWLGSTPGPPSSSAPPAAPAAPPPPAPAPEYRDRYERDRGDEDSGGRTTPVPAPEEFEAGGRHTPPGAGQEYSPS